MELGSPRPPNRHFGDEASHSAKGHRVSAEGPLKLTQVVLSKFVMRLSRERHSRRPVPLPTAEDPLVQTAEVNFICSHCGSFYEVVRAKALPDSVDRPDNVPNVHWTASCPRSAIRAANTFSCGKPTAGGVARRSAPSLTDARRFSKSSWQAVTAATKQIAMPAAAKSRISRS